ncbi:MAG: hypothetical protein PHO65_05150 [Sulfurovum sp.]|nr:hypothetical protein [Sulfurovum sp.]
MTLMLLLAACSSKTDDSLSDHLEKNKTAYKHLQKTEKVQLYDHNITKALLTATYLYPSGKKSGSKENDEMLIVGLYLDEQEGNGIGREYLLTLDGEKPKSILPLPKESPYLKEIPFVTAWNSYYLVTFPHTPCKKFTLLFESSRYGKKTMPFSKAAKYVESQEAF